MKRLIFLLILILTTLSTSSISANSNIALKSSLLYGVPDSINHECNLTFYFRFNQTDLDVNYLLNKDSFRQLDKLLTDPKLHSIIDTLKIVTSASPDGKYDYNLKLAQKRVFSIKRMLLSRYPLLKSASIDIDYYVADWIKLENLIKYDIDMPWLGTVIEILNQNVSSASKERQLREFEDSWQYITNKYLKYLREWKSGISIIIKKVEVKKEVVPIIKIEEKANPILKPLLKVETVLLPCFAIKTNLLYGALAYAPNLAVEFGLGDHTTLDISGSYNWFNLDGGKNNNKKLVHWIIQPEFRYFLKERFRGHFFGFHTLYSEYNIGGYELPMLFGDGSKNYRHEGNAYGVGFSYGYQLPISKCFSLEFNIGGGYMQLQYDKYKCTTCGDLKENNTIKHYFGPTKAGISLIFLINKNTQNK